MLEQNGFPAVISIKSNSEVLADASKHFNKQFLHFLTAGNSILASFTKAYSLLKTENPSLHEYCCCKHEHTNDCGYKHVFLKKLPIEKGHALHSIVNRSCDCYKHFSDPIHHQIGCKDYDKFYNEISKVTANTAYFGPEEPLTEETRYDGARNRMCCCKPDLPHDEAEKFKLHGKKEAWEKPIFNPS